MPFIAKRFIARGLLTLALAMSFAQGFIVPATAQGIQLFTNNASTATTTSVSTSATSVTVTSGTGALFPTLTGGNWFVATLETLVSGLVTSQEIVKVTARSGDTFTIVRAQEGTAAQAFAIGATITLLPTAGGLSQFEQPAQVQKGSTNFAVDTGSANAYSVTLTPALTAHVSGMPIRFLAANTNTGNSTFNDGAGSAPLISNTNQGLQLGPNAIYAAHVYTAIWNGIGSDFQLQDPSSPAATGTFAISLGGASGGVSTAYYRIVGPMVSLFLPTNFSGTGSATTFTIGPLPTVIQPAAWYGASALLIPVPYCFDGGVFVTSCMAEIDSGSATITLFKNGSNTGWTASGSRAAGGVLNYSIF